MRFVRVYQTHIEVSPYRLGDIEPLERMCSTGYDYVRRKRHPIGYLYDEESQTLLIPRGISIPWLCDLTGATPEYFRSSGEARMKYRYKMKVKPKNENQLKAICFLLGVNGFESTTKYSQLCLTVEPGFGKTFCGTVAALERGMRTIIICHTTKIYDQWISTIKNMTTVKEDRITEPRGTKEMEELIEKEVDTDIIILLHSSLNAYMRKHGYQGLQEFFDKLECGTKIIDEVHLFFKNTMQIDFCSNVQKNYYFTATMSRSSSIEEPLFKTVFRNAVSYGKELGITQNIVYRFVYYNSRPTDFDQANIKTAYGPNSYKFMKYALEKDIHQTILGAFFFALEDANTHEGKTLVITPKISNCELLAKLIKNEYPDKVVGTRHSKHASDTNREIEDRADIIVATLGGLGTGSDIEGLRNLIVIGELFSSEVTSKQLPKRCRPWPNGEDSYCYELVDTGFESIMAMVRKKTKYIKQVARKIETITY